MDILKSKEDLKTLEPHELDLLSHYFNITAKNPVDRLWLLAIAILSTRKYSQMKVAGKKLKRVDFDEYFKIIRKLGKGTYGRVVLARLKKDYKNLPKDSKVAVKLIKRYKITKKNIANLNKEIGILEQLSSMDNCDPGVSCYYDHFITTVSGEDSMAIVMEYIPGGDLFQKVADSVESPETMTMKQILAYMQSLANTLKNLHAKNIVHRDIKPENIMVTPELVPKYIDFGFSCLTIPEHPFECKLNLKGTPAFLSPELLKSQKTTLAGEKLYDLYRTSDVWALGLVFYEMLFKKAPTDYDRASTLAEFTSLITSNNPVTFPPPESVLVKRADPRLIEIVKGMLKKDLEQRSTINEVAAKLDVL